MTAMQAPIRAPRTLQVHPVTADNPLLQDFDLPPYSAIRPEHVEPAVDAVVVVTAPAAVQAERVLARPGMTRERFDAILARQLPDAEKRRRADFVIDTSVGLEAARARVDEIVGMVLAEGWTPPRRSLPQTREPSQ